jgi:hypothetical protein
MDAFDVSISTAGLQLDQNTIGLADLLVDNIVEENNFEMEENKFTSFAKVSAEVKVTIIPFRQPINWSGGQK